MILAYLLLFTGLTISAVAIYYSVVGLTAIFSAAAIPIMIMGVSLEVAKLVCATWIKQYWHQVPKLMKTYMVTAVIVLMLITSMGIFGFLSKAHNDQNLVSGDVQSKIAIYDEKIKTAKDNIEANRKSLRQMDEAVDQVMGRSSDEKGADKAVAIRRSQAKDRAALAKDIEANQKIISTLNDEAAPIRAEVRKVDAEVGPIKYIAAFLYGTAPDGGMLEKAVTWIIIMIVVVFDPLAVIMLLASQMTFGWQRGVKPQVEEVKEEPVEEKAPSFLDKLKDIKNNVLQPKEPKLKVVEVDDGTPNYEGVRLPNGEWIQTGPAFTTRETRYEPDDGALTDDQIRQINAMTQGYADQAREEELAVLEELVGPEEVKEEVKPDPEVVSPNAPGLDASVERPGDYLKPAEQSQPEPQREAAPGRNRGVMFSQPITADNGIELGKASNASFGSVFPTTPEKGDVYLRTDYLPNRLFKFNGKKWIEVDKTQTDVYAYEEEYIKHLISEIDAGRYDPDTLTDVEREQIQQYLTKNVQ